MSVFLYLKQQDRKPARVTDSVAQKRVGLIS